MTTPGKMIDLGMLPPAEQREFVKQSARIWTALHAIAPGREIELAEAMPRFVQLVVGFVKATEDWNAAVEQIIGAQPRTGIQVSELRDLLTKLGLNESPKP